MSSKEVLLTEIAGLDDVYTDEVLQFVRQLNRTQRAARSGSLLTNLKGVRISAPADFAKNLDLYVSGEKRIDSDVH